MDRTIWKVLMDALDPICRKLHKPQRRPQYSDRLIVAMYLWSVFNDRCLSWACEKHHYGSLFRPRKLPSISQFSRRVASGRCQLILQRLQDELSRRHAPVQLAYMDGKALLVSPVSKDRDARRGRITGGFGKGYKLHAYVTEDRRIVLWSVMPLPVAEQSVAAELLEHLPPQMPGALLLMDSNYDSANLHKASDQTHTRMFSPLKNQKLVKEGAHHPVTLRQMGQSRREAVAVWKEHPDLAKYVLKQRDEIERTFGVLCSFTGGLQGLPSFVRHLDRVRRWVGAKILIYHARLLVQKAAAERA
jgi:hypothetical protein